MKGLESLERIGGSIDIGSCSNLESISALYSLTYVGGSLSLAGIGKLATLNGLQSLDTIGNDLILTGNSILNNLFSLSNLDLIGDDIIIRNNNTLGTLDGLNNIDPDVLDFVRIENNDNLSVCQTPTICAFLEINGDEDIANNAVGCNSANEVEEQCDGCPYFITFSNQEQIDNFSDNYPDCTEIGGGVEIMGDDIENLEGLSDITFIGGRLTINGANNLSSFEGLENVTVLGGDFNLMNNESFEKPGWFGRSGLHSWKCNYF